MRRAGLPSLIAFVTVTVLAVAGVIVAGWRPLLGLDLQGGLSVVLKPKADTDSDKLDQAIGIIRNRVDALGVAEPDIARQGNTIVVSLPGVKDQQRALDLVGHHGRAALPAGARPRSRPGATRPRRPPTAGRRPPHDRGRRHHGDDRRRRHDDDHPGAGRLERRAAVDDVRRRQGRQSRRAGPVRQQGQDQGGLPASSSGRRSAPVRASTTPRWC